MYAAGAEDNDKTWRSPAAVANSDIPLVDTIACFPGDHASWFVRTQDIKVKAIKNERMQHYRHDHDVSEVVNSDAATL